NSLPAYLQIANILREKILQNKFEIHCRIPTELEISKKYHVSRMTARQAVTYLLNEGLVYRVHGSGTYVASSKLSRNLNRLSNFTQDMEKLNLNPRSILLELQKREPTDREQANLNIGKKQKVYFVSRIRLINNKRIGVQNFVTPVSLVPGLEEIDLENSSFYKFLDSINQIPIRGEQKMEAMLAPKIAILIGADENSPFFYFSRVSYTENNIPIEQLDSYFLGEYYSFNISLTAN